MHFHLSKTGAHFVLDKPKIEQEENYKSRFGTAKRYFAKNDAVVMLP